MDNEKYTFIINTYPTKERNKELKNTLDTIFNQSYKNFDVLLVENYKDKTKINLFLKKYRNQKNKIKLIVDPTKRLSYLFDIAWRNTKSDFLAFVADDVGLEPQWLTVIHEEFTRNKKIGVVTGPIISKCFPSGEMHRLYLKSRKNLLLKLISWPYLHFSMEDSILKPGNLFDSGAYSIGASLQEATEYDRQEIDLATTSSMGIKRSVLEKINGFDRRFYFNHADGDLFIRIKKAGYKIIFNPKAISHHNMRLGPSRNSYFIGLDTGIFYRKDIRPKSLKGIIGAILNISFLNSYWLYNFFRTREPSQLKGILGFLKGFIFG